MRPTVGIFVGLWLALGAVISASAEEGAPPVPYYRGTTSRLVFGPDGSRLALIYEGSERGLYELGTGFAILDGADGRVIRTQDTPGCTIRLAAFSPDNSRLVTQRYCTLPSDLAASTLEMLVETEIASGKETELAVLTGNPDWPHGSLHPKAPWLVAPMLQALAYDRFDSDRVLLLAARQDRARPIAPFDILALPRGGTRQLVPFKTLPLGADKQEFGLEAQFPPLLTSDGRLILFSLPDQQTRGFPEHIIDRDAAEPTVLPFDLPSSEFRFVAAAGSGQRFLMAEIVKPNGPETREEVEELAVAERDDTGEMHVRQLTELRAAITRSTISEDGRHVALVAMSFVGDDPQPSLYLADLGHRTVIRTDTLEKVGIGRTTVRPKVAAEETLRRLKALLDSGAVVEPSTVERLLGIRFDKPFQMSDGHFYSALEGPIAVRADQWTYQLEEQRMPRREIDEQQRSQRAYLTFQLRNGLCLTVPQIKAVFGETTDHGEPGLQLHNRRLRMQQVYQLQYQGPNETAAFFSIAGQYCAESVSISQSTGRFADQLRAERQAREAEKLAREEEQRNTVPFTIRDELTPGKDEDGDNDAKPGKIAETVFVFFPDYDDIRPSFELSTRKGDTPLRRKMAWYVSLWRGRSYDYLLCGHQLWREADGSVRRYEISAAGTLPDVERRVLAITREGDDFFLNDVTPDREPVRATTRLGNCSGLDLTPHPIWQGHAPAPETDVYSGAVAKRRFDRQRR